ncbi:hypothetical protein [Tumebacillus permanentifrigoris]|uniref:hypothetical protein n=1 Tax=Tumebacillus permanentifrigoris TaxID=378543 RepID=UPI0011B29D6B|nr:hypothetical protein [Tumebacillus permanentifrigoris]
MTQEQNVLLAAASCARAVVAKFSRESDKEVGELKVTLSQRAKAFRDLADSLQARGQSIIPPTTGGTALAAPYSGTSGTSGTFSRGMMSR